jgi:PucR C-terminal helix-turn-helix domain
MRGAATSSNGHHAVRTSLASRLRLRRRDVESAVRAHAESRPTEHASAEEYDAGRGPAAIALLDHCLTGIEQADGCAPVLPYAAIVQAHRAARGGISLDSVLIEYAAGHELLTDLLIDEAADLPKNALRAIVRGRRELFEGAMESLAAEYRQERDRIDGLPEQHKADLAKRLLSGSPVSSHELDYELGAWHLGVIMLGAGAPRQARRIGERLGCHLLAVSPAPDVLWAWLGGTNRLSAELLLATPTSDAPRVPMAIGEPGEDIQGWRATHQQAKEASRLLTPGAPTARFADVLLLAAVLADRTVATGLTDLYLAPLTSQPDGGAVALSTLRAFFASGHNVRAAAAALGVDRNTVRSRLDRIERRLGYPLHTRQAELEIAMRLEASGAPQTPTVEPPSRPLPAFNGRQRATTA